MSTRIHSFLSVLRDMRVFLIFFLTQTFSSLGSMITGYALVLWSYQQTGSALSTALLMVSSYTPYVLCSIFAGALSDRWDRRKTILVCDLVAAMTTLVTFVLLRLEALQIWHLYLINAVGGLMNTVQQPASEVATTALIPRQHYQRVGAMQQMAQSICGILQPLIATAMLTLLGMDAVIGFDLLTFAVAFVTLLLFIRIPTGNREPQKESLMKTVRAGLTFLWEKRGLLMLVLFLAAINLVASMYTAALPALILPTKGENVLGLQSTVTGLSTLVGSFIAMLLPAPKSRVRVICVTLFISMSTENFALAFSRSPIIWCIGAVLGWLVIPLMNTNLDAIMRLNIPEALQGRVYAVRNAFQFFTIPLGYLLGGLMVDQVFEPLMAHSPADWLVRLFGTGKGSGAACFFAVIGVMGVLVCLCFIRLKSLREMEEE